MHKNTQIYIVANELYHSASDIDFTYEPTNTKIIIYYRERPSHLTYVHLYIRK